MIKSNDTEHDKTQRPKWSRVVSFLFKFAIPMVISVGLCWVLFREDSLDEMLSVIRTKCDFKWIGFMMLVSFMSYIFRALRWRIQLDGVGVKCDFADILYSIFGTYAVNLVIPRLGEVWRSGFIAHRAKASFGTVVGTMLADRFADLITVILFIVATLIAVREAIVAFVERYPQGYEKIVGLVTSPIVWAVIVGLVVAAVWFMRSRGGNGIVLKIRRFCQELWSGFASILKIRQKWQFLLWTVMLWGCYLWQMYLAFQAFPFTREILETHGFVAVLVCFTLGSIAMGVPSNGGIGPYQIALIFGLGLYAPTGMDAVADKAFDLDSKAFANLVLTMSTCLTILLGLWAFLSIALRPKSKSNP